MKVIEVLPSGNQLETGWIARLAQNHGHWEYHSHSIDSAVSKLIYSLEFKVNDTPKRDSFESIEMFNWYWAVYYNSIVAAHRPEYQIVFMRATLKRESLLQFKHSV